MRLEAQARSGRGVSIFYRGRVYFVQDGGRVTVATHLPGRRSTNRRDWGFWTGTRWVKPSLPGIRGSPLKIPTMSSSAEEGPRWERRRSRTYAPAVRHRIRARQARLKSVQLRRIVLTVLTLLTVLTRLTRVILRFSTQRVMSLPRGEQSRSVRIENLARRQCRQCRHSLQKPGAAGLAALILSVEAS
jgi:hypothetical protein